MTVKVMKYKDWLPTGLSGMTSIMGQLFLEVRYPIRNKAYIIIASLFRDIDTHFSNGEAINLPLRLQRFHCELNKEGPPSGSSSFFQRSR